MKKMENAKQMPNKCQTNAKQMPNKLIVWLFYK